jgi:predicted ATP-grasp superfamily ATP-dependent carboligase
MVVMRVLITDVSSYKAAVVARFLQQVYPDAEVIATDHRPFVQRIHTRWVKNVILLKAGPDDSAVYVESIADLVKRHSIDVLIPVNSREIRLLMDNKALLGGSLDYMGSVELYGLLDDKIAFGMFLHDANIPAPQPHSTIDATLPLVVKPARGSSAKGVHYLRTDLEREDFRTLHGTSPEDCVIQDYFNGEGIGYSGFFRDGKILAGYAHRRVGEYPVSGGSSVVREKYPYDDLPQLVALVERVLERVPWSGFAMFELKRRGPGDFGFIECNPRIWGSVHQGLSDGINYFAPLMGEPRHPPLPSGKMTALLPLNILAMFSYFQAGKYSMAFKLLKASFHARVDINPLTDPFGFLALLRRGA